MLVYEIPGNVSWAELSAAMKAALLRCCQKAGAQVAAQTGIASRVPWLDGESPTRSSTMARVSGQNLRAQRGTIPPCECPTMSIGPP
jgi:hypothetical protein